MPLGSNCEKCNAAPPIEFHNGVSVKQDFDYCIHCSADMCNDCMNNGTCKDSPNNKHQSSEQYSIEHESKPFPHEQNCMKCRSNSRCCQCGKFVDRKHRCTNGRCQECCQKICKHFNQRS